ncbi:MAG TPA: DUF192 domain-containing protein [Rhodanobacteraceae bacterium]
MKRGSIHRDGVCLVPTVWRADNPVTRLRGLLGRPPLRGSAQEALLLVPCNSVHTFWMRYALDLVFLDADERVLGWVEGLRPWRAKTWLRAKYTLELAAGGLGTLRPARGEKWSWQPV